MGIQTTISITRQEAEEKYASKKCQELKDVFLQSAKSLDNENLENEIEEYFYNYLITI